MLLLNFNLFGVENNEGMDLIPRNLYLQFKGQGAALFISRSGP